MKSSNDDNFDKDVSQHEVVLVDFWAPWCGPCKMLSPILEEIELELVNAGLSDKIGIIKIDVDDGSTSATAAMFSVRSIPTLILMEKGTEIDRKIGVTTKGAIMEWLKPHMAKEKAPDPESICMFDAEPCSKVAVKDAKEHRYCVCLHCHAWLQKNLPGYELWYVETQLKATKKHLDAAYEAAGVSHMSSRPLSHYIREMRTALEQYAKTEPDDGAAKKALRHIHADGSSGV